MEPGLIVSNISIELSTLATLGFYLMATVYIIFTAIMYYHWNEYSTSARVSSITLICYLATTIPLIGTLCYLAFTI